jgi:thiol:disulfide interchange protein DsbD
MNRGFLMRALLAGLLLLAAGLVHAQLGGTVAPGAFGAAAAAPKFLPVEEAYQASIEVREDKSLRIHWQIAATYYLYQHGFKFALADAQGDIPLVVELPAGLQREDEFFGKVEVYYDVAEILLVPERTPQVATLSLESQGCADAGLCYPPRREYFEVDFASGSVTPVAAPARGAAVDAAAGGMTSTGTLLYMLLLAFVGGAILNLMPCVFPILSLKVLSFARSSDHDRHLHSWLYAAGVVASFVLVAAVLIALQQAGQAIGWGFQLQSPGFVIALAYLFIAMGLSLSGLVEFGGGLMNAGNGLANRAGLSGSFFTGVLAVVVASPCTAPFMGTALGFALGQPPQVALLVFAALGAGMASPLLLLGYSSFVRNRMPKPGPWMVTLKELLAFPLYATAIWLLWVAGRQTGVNTMTAALVGALALALGLWLWRYGKLGKALALACILAAVGLGSWRALDETGAGVSGLAAGKVAWSEQSLAQLRSAGTPVFVDVTADWCITCKANEAAVLRTADVSAAFADAGIVYMVADWTNYDADIAGFLRQHQRNGIPLYLLYPADPNREPLLLPQLLTRDTVLEAVRAISTQKPDVAVF